MKLSSLNRTSPFNSHLLCTLALSAVMAFVTGCGKSKSNSTPSSQPTPTIELPQALDMTMPGPNDSKNVELFQLRGLSFALKSITILATSTNQPDRLHFSYVAATPGQIDFSKGVVSSQYEKNNSQNSYYEFSLAAFVPKTVQFADIGMISDGEPLQLSGNSNGVISQSYNPYYFGSFVPNVTASYTNILYPRFKNGVGSYQGYILQWARPTLVHSAVIQKLGNDLVINFQVNISDQTWLYKMVLSPTAQLL